MSKKKAKTVGPLTEGEWADFAEGRAWKELDGYLRDRVEILRNDLERAKEKPLTEAEHSAESIRGELRGIRWLMAVPIQLPQMMKAVRETNAKNQKEKSDAGTD